MSNILTLGSLWSSATNLPGGWIAGLYFRLFRFRKKVAFGLAWQQSVTLLNVTLLSRLETSQWSRTLFSSQHYLELNVWKSIKCRNASNLLRVEVGKKDQAYFVVFFAIALRKCYLKMWLECDLWCSSLDIICAGSSVPIAIHSWINWNSSHFRHCSVLIPPLWFLKPEFGQFRVVG